jgi:V/A-type H+-transporting ATPase subunit E
MATVNISGTNKLAERIVNDAQEEARATLNEAMDAARDVRCESDKAVCVRREELSGTRARTRKNLIDGYATRALLDAKKDALRKKRAVIDTAFSRAYDATLSLSVEARKSICAGMIASQAEGGETVLPAKSDRAALAEVIAALPEKKLTLSKDDAKIDGGFILLGDGYEKDCSYRSLLATIRDAEETAVYQLLFD